MISDSVQTRFSLLDKRLFGLPLATISSTVSLAGKTTRGAAVAIAKKRAKLPTRIGLPGGQIVHEPLVFVNKLTDNGEVIGQGLGLQFREDVFLAYQPLHKFVQKGQEILELFEMVLQLFVSEIERMPISKLLVFCKQTSAK